MSPAGDTECTRPPQRCPSHAKPDQDSPDPLSTNRCGRQNSHNVNACPARLSDATRLVQCGGTMSEEKIVASLQELTGEEDGAGFVEAGKSTFSVGC